MGAQTESSLHLESVPLSQALFCAECEMISNSRTYCLCCGSSAVIPVARVFGGSLSASQRAVLISASQDALGYAIPPARKVSLVDNAEAAA